MIITIFKTMQNWKNNPAWLNFLTRLIFYQRIKYDKGDAVAASPSLSSKRKLKQQ